MKKIILLITLISTCFIYPQSNPTVVDYEIYFGVVGQPDATISTLIAWLEATTPVWTDPTNLTDEYDYAEIKHHTTGSSDIPIPTVGINQNTKYGAGNMITPSGWSNNNYGYGKYKFSIGWWVEGQLPGQYVKQTAFSFYIDMRDCDYPADYQDNDIYITYNYNTNSVTVKWDLVQSSETLSQNATYTYWDEKKRLNGTISGENDTDCLALITTLTSVNNHPHLVWNAAYGDNYGYYVNRKIVGPRNFVF